MRPTIAATLTATLTLLLAGTVAAEPAATATVEASARLDHSFGMRVGGYGFRSPEGDRRNGWDDCRMNGLGAFGQRVLGEHAFVEAGADLYFAESFPFDPHGEGMDRLSGLLTTAGGLRMFPASRVSAYVQLGVGLELTKVRVAHAGHVTSDSFVLPVGFVGFGGDLRLGDRLRLGMNLRTYLMGHFPHDHGGSGHPHAVAPVSAEPPALSPEPEAAAQAQFYVSYSL